MIEYNNNIEDSSSEANYKSKRTSQNEELSRVLEALESLGFRPLEYQEK
jgi:Holliday junction resolvasome RuvABC DNA-binding subunit